MSNLAPSWERGSAGSPVAARLKSEQTYVDQELDPVLLEVSADLGRQQDAGAGAEFAVLLVEFALQHQLLEIHEGHGDGGLLEVALVLRQLPDLSLQAAAHKQAVITHSLHTAHYMTRRGAARLYLRILLSVRRM